MFIFCSGALQISLKINIVKIGDIEDVAEPGHDKPFLRNICAPN